MSRYDHFRKWLTEQSPRSSAAAPSPARARYMLPEYRLPPTPDPQIRVPAAPAPVWIDPQGMVPPVFPPYDSPVSSPDSSGASLPVLPPPQVPPRAIAPLPQTPPPAIYSAALAESRPSPSRYHLQPQLPAQSPVNPALRWYSYGLVVLVWLGLLGLGTYAVGRLLDPVFVSTEASPASPPTPQSVRQDQPRVPSRSTAEPQYDAVAPTAATAIAPSVPSPFEYADATPRPNTSPIWALVAVIAASALGARLMGQRTPRSRHR